MSVIKSVACVVFSLVCSCSPSGGVTTNLTAYQKQVMAYFDAVALGFEFGNAPEVTRKWREDLRIFVGGNPNEALMLELAEIIAEVNALTTDGFDIGITTDTLESNGYIFFGSGKDFVKRFAPAAPHVDSNFGLFFVNYDGSDYIYESIIYVDIFRANPDAQKHLLREELTQSLGLARDSPQYDDSIFQRDWTLVTSYAPIDRDLIRLLYHPAMPAGIEKKGVDEILGKLLPELRIGE